MLTDASFHDIDTLKYFANVSKILYCFLRVKKSLSNYPKARNISK